MTRAAMLCGVRCGRKLDDLREVFEEFWGAWPVCFICAYCERCRAYFCKHFQPGQHARAGAQLEMTL